MAKKKNNDDQWNDDDQHQPDDDDSEEEEDDQTSDDQDQDDDGDSESPQDMIERLVQEKLKPMKSSMDKMAKERDQAQKEAERLRKEAAKAEEEDLKSRGKHTEALKMKLDKSEEEKEALQQQLVDLSRSQAVSEAISNLPFRNERAMELAKDDINRQLRQDSDGNWVHESGLDLKSFMEDYTKNSDNEFLFKPKNNSGAGGTKPGSSKKPEKPKTFSEMSSSEAIRSVKEQRGRA
jgi:hypothetical protein